jgi:hypothetical protein
VIGYYVHHHGSGHVNRALSIAAALSVPVVGLSSGARPEGWTQDWVQLDDDVDGVEPDIDDVTAGSTLHWVPRHHAGLRSRMAAISSVLAGADVRLLVCDVSVEVALLARLHGVPVVVVAQPGDRTDRAHRTAYDLADALVAPWPERPLRPGPATWADKTVHVGGFSRFDGRVRPAPSGGARRVLLLWGSGGTDTTLADVYGAADATPRWRWELLSEAPAAGATAPDNVVHLGWTADPWPAICGADVVVTHAGQNAVAEVAAARRPAVVVPQARPFGEQLATADALERGGFATVRRFWPPPAQWPAVLDAAVATGGGRWDRWSPGDGARRAARRIERCAAAT